jgi:hypothetical protein
MKALFFIYLWGNEPLDIPVERLLAQLRIEIGMFD